MNNCKKASAWFLILTALLEIAFMTFLAEAYVTQRELFSLCVGYMDPVFEIISGCDRYERIVISAFFTIVVLIANIYVLWHMRETVDTTEDDDFDD